MKKKNIVVCCEEMLLDIQGRCMRIEFEGMEKRYITVAFSDRKPLKVCPRCGKELPFPYEESE